MTWKTTTTALALGALTLTTTPAAAGDPAAPDEDLAAFAARATAAMTWAEASGVRRFVPGSDDVTKDLERLGLTGLTAKLGAPSKTPWIAFSTADVTLAVQPANKGLFEVTVVDRRAKKVLKTFGQGPTLTSHVRLRDLDGDLTKDDLVVVTVARTPEASRTLLTGYLLEWRELGDPGRLPRILSHTVESQQAACPSVVTVAPNTAAGSRTQLPMFHGPITSQGYAYVGLKTTKHTLHLTRQHHLWLPDASSPGGCALFGPSQPVQWVCERRAPGTIRPMVCEERLESRVRPIMIPRPVFEASKDFLRENAARLGTLGLRVRPESNRTPRNQRRPRR
jgi:hypothetical protein